VLAKKEKYGEISLICGGRTPNDILYSDEVDELCHHIPVMKGVRNYFSDAAAAPKDPANAIGITCGPPVMIKAVIENLEKLGFQDQNIYTTIENKMKCGIGKCGRCNVGKDYLCTKGPIYSWQQLKQLPQEY
jgi:NAD(P)H-flavin reductase